MTRNLFLSLGALALILAVAACNEDPTGCDCSTDDKIEGEYNPQAYELDVPDWLGQQPVVPVDNPLTVAGVELGRHLFYEPMLSIDSTISCASCHRQNLGFADGSAVSTGVQGRQGSRSAMPLVNLAWNPSGFFWDGRAPTLEALALIPIEDHREMAETWENVEEKLRRHPEYPRMFREAFGVETKGEITRDLAAKAIAQFIRTLTSFNSKFDRVVNLNDGWLSEMEELGRDLFFIEFADQTQAHPGCSHCHVGQDFTDHSFRNNGLDNVASLDQFTDLGLGEVTGNYYDNGKFKVPSLRNVELTAPYMHDGRFATLEEVLENYSRGGHPVENEDVNIQPFELTDQKKAALIAFLKTLTDQDFVNNPEYSNPFEE